MMTIKLHIKLNKEMELNRTATIRLINILLMYICKYLAILHWVKIVTLSFSIPVGIAIHSLNHCPFLSFFLMRVSPQISICHIKGFKSGQCQILLQQLLPALKQPASPSAPGDLEGRDFVCPCHAPLDVAEPSEAIMP